MGVIDLNGNCCNTSWFLPQNRERIYLVGYSAEPPRNWRGIFPIQKDDTVPNGSTRDNEGELQSGRPRSARTITARYWKMGSSDTYIKMADYRNDEGLRIREEDESPCLSARRHSEKDISTMPPLAISGAIRTYPRGSVEDKDSDERGKRLETREDGVSNAVTTHPLDSVVVPTQLGNSKNYGNAIKDKGDDAFTIRSSEPNGIVSENKIRRLTPVECERLQGFPDDWTKMGDYNGEVKPVSNTQRYKTCGNAVTVDVVYAVVQQLKEIL